MTRGMWKHPKWRDLRFETLKVVYRGPEYLKVKGRYWIQGVENAWPVHPNPVTLKIYYTERWERVNNELVQEEGA